MEQMKCQSCGAPLVPTINGDYHCEYCGSLYRIERPSYPSGVVKYIEVLPPTAETIGAKIIVSDYIMRAAGRAGATDDLSQRNIEQLAHELARGLAAYMRIDTEKDPVNRATIIRGSVRVIPPDYKF